MPELPEVHTTVESLNASIIGLCITDVWSDYNSPFHNGKPNIKNRKFFNTFKNTVVNQKILSVTRRAKNILIHTSGGHTILIHMKMTGHLLYGSYVHKTKTRTSFLSLKWNGQIWEPDKDERESLKDPFNRHIYFVLSFNNKKHLALSDMRKFAKITLLDTKTLEDSEDLRSTGPEPLELTKRQFKEALLARSQGKIKQVLINHEIIAGIGNIYSDEMLWRAGIHPLEKVENISEKQWAALFTAMKHVLKKGIDFKGDSTQDYRAPDGTPGKFHAHHRAYQRTGKKCEKRNCSGITERITIAGRSAHFCSTHQKLVDA